MIWRRAGALLLALVAIGGTAVADGGKDEGKGKDKDKGQISAPELDPGSIPGALLLLAGGTAVLLDRLRRE
ncbi:hypothetical protein EP7_002380 [Isosphaeraceae bacterium EP7]